MRRLPRSAYSRSHLKITLTNEEDDRRFPPVPQAIIRANPVNGRKALYVGLHASHIRGMPEDEAVRCWPPKNSARSRASTSSTCPTRAAVPLRSP